MIEQGFARSQDGTPPENYQRYFVPSIGAPLAGDLIDAAGLRPGQRVLDVACGTGVLTRLAAEQVGATGAVAGLDVNPGMLAVASSQGTPGVPIDWCQASAESMPLPDSQFDVVLCQMGLQFVPDRLAALREMRRVLDQDGRVWITVPGPKPPMFAILIEALSRHLGPESAAFADLVFSMHDGDELTALMRGAGFRDVDVRAGLRTLRLPPPAEFLWQYIHSTPLAEAADRASEAGREALERDVCRQWEDFVNEGSIELEVRMTTATALK